MKKMLKKAGAALLAGIMAAGMAVSVSAASTCPPHTTTEQYLGIAYDQIAGTHKYLYEKRLKPDGTVEETWKSCTMRAVGKKYGYKCSKCSLVTSSWTESTIVHTENCGQQ